MTVAAHQHQMIKLAQRIAARLGGIEGVVAVALGGSLAQGEGHPDSDIDLGLYYRPARPPALAALCALAGELDDRHPDDVVTDFGAWGPWINGGAWLVIEGRRVDWLYRDLDLVERTIADCHAGRIRCDYQPGHPHGFHTHIYLSEVHHARPLHDPRGTLAALKALAVPYPPALRQTLIHKSLWEADFSLQIAHKPAARGDAFYVSGCLFRAAACLVQVLYALNERYCVNEKGSVQAAGAFPLCPPGFVDEVMAVHAHPGRTPDALQANVARLEVLCAAIRALCAARPHPPANKREHG